MYELKTKENDRSVVEFIENVENPTKREDAYKLLDIFTETTGYQAKMWGPSIIGFGRYHYRYASGHEGDAPLVGFSPRKLALSLYVFTGLEEHAHLLRDLGKFKMGKACIYVKKLEDVDLRQLAVLVKTTINYLQTTYGKNQH
jgi:hypothetical protein